MQYEVRVCEVDPQPMAAARGHGHARNYINQLFALLDEVWRFLRANPQIGKSGHNVFLYWNDGDKDLFQTAEGLPIEAGVQVAAPFDGTGAVVYSATPGGTVATTVHIGPYDQLSKAHAALRDWCQTNNYSLLGPHWEVYGDWNDDPEKLQTDVFYLVKYGS